MNITSLDGATNNVSSCHEDLFGICFHDNESGDHAQRIIYELVTIFVRAYTGTESKASEDLHTTLNGPLGHDSGKFAAEMDQLFAFIHEREINGLENQESGDDLWEHFCHSWKHLTDTVRETGQRMKKFIRHGLLAYRDLHTCLEDEENLSKEVASAVGKVTLALRNRGRIYEQIGGKLLYGPI